MYTNQELDSIASTLSSLTAEELNYLKMKIDLILSQKKIFDLSVNQVNPQKYIPETYAIIGSCIPLKSKATTEKFGLVLESGIENIIEGIKPAKKHRRPSGMWKGKVKMPDEFDELSNDILADFGID